MGSKELNKKKMHCFVCNALLHSEEMQYNKKVNLPVCKKCIGTKKEEDALKEALDSLGDGFVCGCI